MPKPVAPENHIEAHDRRRAEAEADILAVFALTGRKTPDARDLAIAAGSVATFPTAWRQDRDCSWPARSILIDYSNALEAIAAQRAAA